MAEIDPKVRYMLERIAEGDPYHAAIGKMSPERAKALLAGKSSLRAEAAAAGRTPSKPAPLSEAAQDFLDDIAEVLEATPGRKRPKEKARHHFDLEQSRASFIKAHPLYDERLADLLEAGGVLFPKNGPPLDHGGTDGSWKERKARNNARLVAIHKDWERLIRAEDFESATREMLGHPDKTRAAYRQAQQAAAQRKASREAAKIAEEEARKTAQMERDELRAARRQELREKRDAPARARQAERVAAERAHDLEVQRIQLEAERVRAPAEEVRARAEAAAEARQAAEDAAKAARQAAEDAAMREAAEAEAYASEVSRRDEWERRSQAARQRGRLKHRQEQAAHFEKMQADLDEPLHDIMTPTTHEKLTGQPGVEMSIPEQIARDDATLAAINDARIRGAGVGSLADRILELQAAGLELDDPQMQRVIADFRRENPALGIPEPERQTLRSRFAEWRKGLGGEEGAITWDPRQTAEENARRFFAPDPGDVGGYKSRELMTYMDPEEFMQLASPLIDHPPPHISHRQFHNLQAPRQRSLEEVRSALAADIPLRDLPELLTDKGAVYGHEGRHRARVLRELGVPRMPVVLVDESIRWDQQSPARADTFDYKEGLPKRLRGEPLSGVARFGALSRFNPYSIESPFYTEGPLRGTVRPEYAGTWRQQVPTLGGEEGAITGKWKLQVPGEKGYDPRRRLPVAVSQRVFKGNDASIPDDVLRHYSDEILSHMDSWDDGFMENPRTGEWMSPEEAAADPDYRRLQETRTRIEDRLRQQIAKLGGEEGAAEFSRRSFLKRLAAGAAAAKGLAGAGLPAAGAEVPRPTAAAAVSAPYYESPIQESIRESIEGLADRRLLTAPQYTNVYGTAAPTSYMRLPYQAADAITGGYDLTPLEPPPERLALDAPAQPESRWAQEAAGPPQTRTRSAFTGEPVPVPQRISMPVGPEAAAAQGMPQLTGRQAARSIAAKAAPWAAMPLIDYALNPEARTWDQFWRQQEDLVTMLPGLTPREKYYTLPPDRERAVEATQGALMAPSYEEEPVSLDELNTYLTTPGRFGEYDEHMPEWVWRMNMLQENAGQRPVTEVGVIPSVTPVVTPRREPARSWAKPPKGEPRAPAGRAWEGMGDLVY